MRYTSILLLPLLVTGCAIERPAFVQTPVPVLIAEESPTKFVETRYDLLSYREGTNPTIRHEAHAIFRRTRVPVAMNHSLETIPRASYAPPSVDPMPASEELTAELATQKKITGELRVMQASMAETEQRMQTQYAQLVRQNAEALKIRDQLEASRTRLHNAPSTETAAGPAAPTPGTAEVKW